MTSIKQKSRNEGMIEQRTEGSWQITVELTPDASGKRRRIRKTVKGSKKDAQKVLRQILLERDENRSVSKSKVTVEQYLERWLEEYVDISLAESTKHKHRGQLNRYIYTTIGDLALQSLNTQHIKGVYTKMSNGTLTGKKLAPKTVIQLHSIFKEALNHAVTDGLLANNPANGIKRPKDNNVHAEMWDVETIKEFLRIAEEEEHKLYPLFKFAVLTGLRRSEICGLKLSSINLDNGTLMVENTLHWENKVGLFDSPPKTEQSRRRLDLSAPAIDILRTAIGDRILASSEAGKHWQKKLDYVFIDPWLNDGTPINPNAPTKQFKTLVKKYGLPDNHFHGLRHAYATLSLLSGTNMKVVSTSLGHSNVTITLNYYAYLMPTDTKDNNDRVASMLGVN